MKSIIVTVSVILLLSTTGTVAADNTGWYTAYYASRDSSYRGGASADIRVKVTLINTLEVFSERMSGCHPAKQDANS